MINLQMLLALAGGLLAAVQAVLIVLKGNILCLNDGCEVVETLTTIPPLAVNVAGSLFFMTLLLALWRGARGARGWLRLASLLLLAGMAVEGVLIGFQQWVAQVFCSYCLVVFGCITLLNMLMGWRQILASFAVFFAVLAAFAALRFVPYSAADGQGLDKGVYGRLEREKSGTGMYLFFSSTCPHCEDVIATLDSGFDCSLNFNPIDDMKKPPLAGLAIQPEYSPAINRRFLKTIGLTEIPVLAVKSTEEIRLVKGEQAIRAYLDGACRKKPLPGEVPAQSSGISGGTNSILPFLAPAPKGNADACSIEEANCEKPAGEGTK